MDALGISYEVMGGPTHCCGVQQLRAGDVATFGRVAENTLDKRQRSWTRICSMGSSAKASGSISEKMARAGSSNILPEAAVIISMSAAPI
jgi:hypothetical protein